MVGRRVTYRGREGTVIRLSHDEAALGDRVWAVVALDVERDESPCWVWVSQSDWDQLEG